jgi:hypothetical protein
VQWLTPYFLPVLVVSQEVSKVKACLDKIDQQNRSASSAVLGAMFQHEVKVSVDWV